jgi:hypothetical protein
MYGLIFQLESMNSIESMSNFKENLVLTSLCIRLVVHMKLKPVLYDKEVEREREGQTDRQKQSLT